MIGTVSFPRTSLSAALAILFSVTGILVTASSASAFCGDANDDSNVTAVDALAILRSAVGTSDVCDRNCECDVNFDREISADDALAALKAAVRHDLHSGCGVLDRCFDDEDCDSGFVCGIDPNWECDYACLPNPTTTTEPIGDCFSDSDCEGDSNGPHCCAYICAECESDSHCQEGFVCDGSCSCVPSSPTTTEEVIGDCFSDQDCEGDSSGPHCCANVCAQCENNSHCPSGFTCSSGCTCIPVP